MDLKSDERLKWLRFVLNPSLPMPVGIDWKGLMEFSQQQAILGIASPMRFSEARPGQDVLLDWMSQVIELRSHNTHLNQRVIELVEILREAGFRCCILKGQGNALMYDGEGKKDDDNNVSLVRTPGDIDVWIDADEDQIRNYVRNRFPEVKECFKHIKFPIFEEVEVDVHHTPLKFYNPFRNRKLQQWIADRKEEQMNNYVRLMGNGSDIAIPTVDFNAIYHLGHIMIHVEDQGIGLRQFVDYYYVLKALKHKSIEKQESVRSSLKKLGLMRIASAVMWVEHEMLGLPMECLLFVPDEIRGKLLADDILKGGNFGHYNDMIQNKSLSRLRRAWAKVLRILKLSPLFPGEIPYNITSRAFGMINNCKR